MTTTHTAKFCDFFNYAQKGVANKLFAGVGIAFSIKESTTYAYSDSYLPDSKIRFSAHTLFDIASMTKSVVAIALLKLIEENIVQLNTPIHPIIGGLGNRWNEITIQHLLTNSLKLDITEKLHEKTPAEIDQIITSANVVRLGDGWYYHNSNTILMGWILEKIYKRPLAWILRETIFKPAEMNYTYFSREIPENMKEHIHPSMNKIIGPQILKGEPHDPIAYKCNLHGDNIACAGLFSTTEDVVKFGNYVIYRAFKDPGLMLAKISHNYLKQFGNSSGLGFDNPKPDYVCPCFEREAIISTGHTGVFLAIQTVTQEVLVILSNITYPAPSLEREKDPSGLAINPLFQYRKELSKICFVCERCNK